ncbi:MAG: hypothetical protein ORN54_03960 [Cyclobacteriaceae bacterium]|nr:hypothetical protein [Cyclobacteriaceae bacterium]
MKIRLDLSKKIVLVILLTRCSEESTKCYTCENFSDGYVIGFDPCTGVLDPNGGQVGFIIKMQKDTVVTYNFPKGTYTFPPTYFSQYQFYCIFPDTAWTDFPVKVKYQYINKNEKTAILCRADIYTYFFDKYVKQREIKILELKK